MVQCHRYQHGIFHVTTNTKGREPWCVFQSIPEIIISNLLLTKRIHQVKLYAFCILPDHMHMIIRPGKRGLTKFVQSFKMNSSREIRKFLKRIDDVPWHTLALSGDFHPTIRAGTSDTEISARISKLHIPIPEKLSLHGCGVFHGWQHGFHDERICDVDQWNNTLRYVEGNAHHHSLVRSPKEWPWTSLHFKYVLDATEDA